MNNVIIICGATASGKTDKSIELARLINAEIVSSDSMQIYKKMNIGTAKITELEAGNIKHHLIDFLEPTKSFSVSEYSSLAINKINEIHSRGKAVILCGGTGLYINSILYEKSYSSTQKDEIMRMHLNCLYDEKGGEHLINEISKHNKFIANKLHFNDRKRVVRAMEIILSGGDFKTNEENEYRKDYDFTIFGIHKERNLLYERINKRVDIMFQMGLENEVKQLLNDGINFNYQSMQAIGYKEFKDYFENNISLNDLKELIKKNTRNYAKRQITWFKRYKDIVWLNEFNYETESKKIFDKLTK